MKKSEICFIIQRYKNGGGTERVVSQIASGLVKMGYGVSVISIDEGAYPVFETDSRVRLYELKMGNGAKKSKIMGGVSVISHILKVRAALVRLAREIKPQIVIAVDVVLYHYADRLRKSLGVKTVCWEHYCLDSRKGALISHSRRLAIKNADLTVVISKGDLRSYKERFKGPKNLRLIYNPLSVKELSSCGGDTKRVIAAGRLTYQKGFDMLLEAWRKVEKEAPQWTLAIFGEGEDKSSLKAQAERCGLKKVSFNGYTDKLYSEMQKSAIFVLSSRYEGFGLVLLEAQAAGLPCVSFDCKEGPREIIDNGINGFLVREGDTKELSERILLLIKNTALRRSFSENSQKDLYRFTPEKILKEWNTVLEEISRD